MDLSNGAFPIAEAAILFFLLALVLLTCHLPINNPAGTSPVVTVTATAGDAGSGATFNTNAIAAISHTEYWLATFTGTYTGGTVLLGRSSLGVMNLVGRSTLQAGSYSSLGGSITNTLISSNTVTSSITTGAALNYFVLCQALTPNITSVVPTSPTN